MRSLAELWSRDSRSNVPSNATDLRRHKLPLGPTTKNVPPSSSTDHTKRNSIEVGMMHALRSAIPLDWWARNSVSDAHAKPRSFAVCTTPSQQETCISLDATKDVGVDHCKDKFCPQIAASRKKNYLRLSVTISTSDCRLPYPFEKSYQPTCNRSGDTSATPSRQHHTMGNTTRPTRNRSPEASCMMVETMFGTATPCNADIF